MKRIVILIAILLALVVNGQVYQPKLKYYIECGEESNMNAIVHRAEASFTTMQRKAYAISSGLQIDSGSISSPNAPDVPRVCVSFWYYE